MKFLLIIATVLATSGGTSLEKLEELSLREQVSRYDTDEPAAARAERLRPLLVALSRLSPVRAAGAWAVMRHESHFAAYVQAGCLDIPEGAARCDGGLALGFSQLHRSACPEAWKLPHGSAEQLEAIVACTDKRLRWALGQCRGLHPHGDGAGMFAGYRAVGVNRAGCTWRGRATDGARKRADDAVRIWETLR